MRKGEEAKFADELYAIWQSRAYLPPRPALSDQDVARLREIAFEHSASATQVMAIMGTNTISFLTVGRISASWRWLTRMRSGAPKRACEPAH